MVVRLGHKQAAGTNTCDMISKNITCSALHETANLKLDNGTGNNV